MIGALTGATAGERGEPRGLLLPGPAEAGTSGGATGEVEARRPVGGTTGPVGLEAAAAFAVEAFSAALLAGVAAAAPALMAARTLVGLSASVASESRAEEAWAAFLVTCRRGGRERRICEAMLASATSAED